MTTFVALYRGRTINDAQLIAVSVDASLCVHVADSMLVQESTDVATNDDLIASAVVKGRHDALKRIAGKRDRGGDATS